MRNIALGLCLLALVACTENKQKLDTTMIQNDSLRAIVDARDSEINDMLGTLNAIQDGLRAINEAENRVTVAQQTEGADKAESIKSDIKFIATRMEENRELLKKLRQQLRETGFKGDQLQRTIDSMTRQLAEKDRELQKLRAELSAKDIHISELDKTISDLNSDVEQLNTNVSALTTEKENLQTENTQKTQTIDTQEKQLNTAWYVFGTKRELKEHGILQSGDVLRGSFDKGYFTKIDIRIDREIKLYTKSVRVLTNHPSGSYNLSKDTNGQYVLRITDPVTFWSTSKYLVIQVK